MSGEDGSNWLPSWALGLLVVTAVTSTAVSVFFQGLVALSTRTRATSAWSSSFSEHSMA